MPDDSDQEERLPGPDIGARELQKLREEVDMLRQTISTLQAQVAAASGLEKRVEEAANAAAEFGKWRKGLKGSGGIDIQDNNFMFNGKLEGTATTACNDAGQQVTTFNLQIKG